MSSMRRPTSRRGRFSTRSWCGLVGRAADARFPLRSEYLRRLREAEREARTAGRGLWQTDSLR